jgi:hypothetical protein
LQRRGEAWNQGSGSLGLRGNGLLLLLGELIQLGRGASGFFLSLIS